MLYKEINIKKDVSRLHVRKLKQSEYYNTCATEQCGFLVAQW